MELNDMLAVAFKVMQDWRVVFATLALAAAVAILRYVGLVYRKRPKAARRTLGPAPSAAAGGGGAQGRAAAREQASDAESELIE